MYKADNLIAICEPKIWEPWCLTTLWASTSCYRDSFTVVTVMPCCLVEAYWCSSEMLGNFFQTTLCHIPEDNILQLISQLQQLFEMQVMSQIFLFHCSLPVKPVGKTVVLLVLSFFFVIFETVIMWLYCSVILRFFFFRVQIYNFLIHCSELQQNSPCWTASRKTRRKFSVLK
jgi:hypothetical protein